MNRSKKFSTLVVLGGGGSLVLGVYEGNLDFNPKESMNLKVLTQEMVVSEGRDSSALTPRTTQAQTQTRSTVIRTEGGVSFSSSTSNDTSGITLIRSGSS